MAITLNNHVFKGHKTLLGSKFVTYGELELPLRSDIHEITTHGFDWGNNSKSAQQLAFSMLYQLSNKDVAIEATQKFTEEIIKSLNSRDWVISASEILKWLEKNSQLFVTTNQNSLQKDEPKLKSNSTKKNKKQM